jgi:hypothetical protein
MKRSTTRPFAAVIGLALCSLVASADEGQEEATRSHTSKAAACDLALYAAKSSLVGKDIVNTDCACDDEKDASGMYTCVARVSWRSRE